MLQIGGLNFHFQYFGRESEEGPDVLKWCGTKTQGIILLVTPILFLKSYQINAEQMHLKVIIFWSNIWPAF